MKTLLLTRNGHMVLCKRADDLEVRLKRLQANVGDTADTGGNQWHDNAGYEQLVIDIRGVNRQLEEVHEALRCGRIVEAPRSFDQVKIGTQVEIIRNGHEKERWSVVGYGESDYDKGRLAYDTPLGRLLINCRVGQIKHGYMGGQKVQIEVCSISSSPDL